MTPLYILEHFWYVIVKFSLAIYLVRALPKYVYVGGCKYSMRNGMKYE